jgi:fructose-1,6-bisphosphatase/inositol monophosphatase family enzyme
MALTDVELENALQLALEAASIAAKLIDECIDRRFAGEAGPSVETKSSSVDMVTEYDKKCEELVLAKLIAASPSNWKVVSEESNSDVTLTDAPTWIVDPIDGTTSFVHGSFDCCVSIGLAVNKVPVLGVVHIPRLKEVFHAVKGKGAFLNGKPIRVSTVNTIQKAIVCTHTPYCRHPAAIKALTEINAALMTMGVHAVRAYGSAAMDLCSVACGRLDLYFETGPWSWDMCAGAIIIREAGGVIHDVDSVSDSLNLESRGYAAGSCKALTAIGVDLVQKTGYKAAILNPPPK